MLTAEEQTAESGASQRIEFGGLNSANPQFRTLQSIHEKYARAVATALAAFLRTDVQVGLRDIAVQTAGGFQSKLPNPTCLMVFRLHPRQERIFLHMDCATVFGLLERLLGGKGAAEPATLRNLTEIEWSLLEEIVRVMVRPLGEAWQHFATVEFEVDALVSEPALLPPADAAQPMTYLAFDLQFGEPGILEIAVPEAFFDSAGAGHELKPATVERSSEPGFEEKIALLDEAAVTLEIQLQGPMLPVATLMDLKPGQVIALNYPLEEPLQGVLNGEVKMEGAIVSAGTKRAFQVSELP